MIFITIFHDENIGKTLIILITILQYYLHVYILALTVMIYFEPELYQCVAVAYRFNHLGFPSSVVSELLGATVSLTVEYIFSRYSFQSVVVKSIEENVANMYEARRLLLGLEKEDMPPQTTSVRINTNLTPSMQGKVMFCVNCGTHIPTTKTMVWDIFLNFK